MYVLPLPVAWSSSDDNAMRYLLPVFCGWEQSLPSLIALFLDVRQFGTTNVGNMVHIEAVIVLVV